MNKALILLTFTWLVILIFALTSCADAPTVEVPASCAVTQQTDGALVTCGESSVLVPNGLPGALGSSGVDGQDGANGLDGVNGGDGTDGQDGAPGAAGQDGTNGTDGTNGQDGAQGPQGDQGLPGTDGQDGAPGADGISCTVSCLSEGTNKYVLFTCANGTAKVKVTSCVIL